MTLLVFEVAGELCAVPTDTIAEIVPMANLDRSPGLPAVVEGVLNLRGKAVPVIRLDRLFGLGPQQPGLYSHLLVLRSRGAALLTARAAAVVSVLPDACRPLEQGASFNGCAVAEVDIDGRSVHVLDPERVLLEEERRRVGEFQVRAQAYIDEMEAAAS